MSTSQRRYPRITLALPIEYIEFERFEQDRTLNLSATGAFILSRKPLPIGRRFSMRVELPDLPNLIFKIQSRVVWNQAHVSPGAGNHHPRGMGVCFDPVSPELMHTLDQYVTVRTGLRNLDMRIGQELPAEEFDAIRAATDMNSLPFFEELSQA